MNKFIVIILLFIISNLIFSVIAFLLPTVPKANIIPYQLWSNAIIIFLLILPTDVGSYVFD